MYHSITIGDKNTWDDWHLVPLSRPFFSPPIPKTNFVDIPGGDGSIDLSTALSGRTVYENRTGTIEFMIVNGYKEWFILYSEIMNYLQGRKLRAVLEDDPGFYYEGRFWLKTWKSGEHYSSITMEYNVSPYKRSVNTNEDWIWDTFNFENGIIYSYTNLSIGDGLTIEVPGTIAGMSVDVTCSDDGVVLSMNGLDYTLEQGRNILSDTVLSIGMNTLSFRGTGTITINNVGRSL